MWRLFANRRNIKCEKLSAFNHSESSGTSVETVVTMVEQQPQVNFSEYGNRYNEL